MKKIILISTIALFTFCTNTNESYKETLLENAWKKAELDIEELNSLRKGKYENVSIQEIRNKYKSELLFISCLDDSTLNQEIEKSELKSLIMDYLISYANVKMIENGINSNEITTPNLRVSPIPLQNIYGIDTVLVKIGMNYSNDIKNLPYLVLDNSDTISFNVEYNCFLIEPKKSNRKLAGWVYVYSFLQKEWLRYPFEILL